MTTTYIKAKDLPEDVATSTKSAIRIKNQIFKIEKQLERKKELLTPYTNSIKDYLLRLKVLYFDNVQGIEVGNRKIYLQDNTKFPSFKQVLEEVKTFLPPETIALLEKQYQDMFEITGKRVVINGREK